MARSPLICFSVFMQAHTCLRTPPPETPDSFFGEKTYGVAYFLVCSSAEHSDICCLFSGYL